MRVTTATKSITVFLHKRAKELLAALSLIVVVACWSSSSEWSESWVEDAGFRRLNGLNPVRVPLQPSISTLCYDDIDLNAISPGEVNQLRRLLASENPSCYERHFEAFAVHFRARIKNVKKHLNLHVPETGGTSFCNLARSAKKDTYPEPSNCFDYDHYRPVWCCGRYKDPVGWGGLSDMCAATDDFLKEFTMNENYLNHPLCHDQRLYSILLRHPVDRARSMERLFSTFDFRMEDADRKARLDLMRKNYMTWSLTADELGEQGKKIRFVPQREDLELAKDTLTRLDFVLEFASHPSDHPGEDLYTRVKCLPVMLELMGFGNNATMTHDNVWAKGKEYTYPYEREQYEEWNELDIEVYEHAKKIAMLDCRFFLRLENWKAEVEVVEK